jgi:hypothetical protein
MVGTPVDVFESASERCGADCIDARDEWQHIYHIYTIHIYTHVTRLMATHTYIQAIQAIAMFLQKAWGIRNAYKHGTSVDVFESASERRGADGIDARA